jgi:hypothetical protein
MSRIPVEIISPQQYEGGGELPGFPIEHFPWKCLAQGDSWFSFGAIPPFLTTNLLWGLELSTGTCIVNCASPGAQIRRMANTTRSRKFLQLLNGSVAMKWDAILLSGGGNDVIDAVESTDASPSLRLLRFQPEWGDPALGPHKYVSDPGWETLRVHLRAVFEGFITARDRGVNRDQPVILHTYDLAAPRNAPAGLGFGPWLSKAFGNAYSIPQADWNMVAEELFNRLHTLLKEFTQDFVNVHLVDTIGMLTPAANDDGAATADWQNEIHPTRDGYQKLSDKWATLLDATL